MRSWIPVCEPTLKGNELKYVEDCIKTNQIASSGKYIDQFEKKFSTYCGVQHGISCANGTAALHLAVEALGIGKGDEVIIPTFTMIATCNAVIYAGAKPVLVDSELKTWNIDADKIEEKITKKTKAIMVVHTYGHPADMDRIDAIAKKYNLKIIEDAAEAHGAEYKGRKTGSLGDIACYSFYANKLITSGEGGMVVTNNDTWAEKIKFLKNHYFGEPRFLHYQLGYNYRMTNIQAAIGLAQLEKMDDFVESRIKNAHYYRELLKDVKGITLPPQAEWAKNIYWMFGILVQDEFGRTMPQLREELQKKGIETRTFFTGMHRQPCYQKNDERFPDVSGSYPVSDALTKKGLYLPSASHLTKEEMDAVVDAIQ